MNSSDQDPIVRRSTTVGTNLIVDCEYLAYEIVHATRRMCDNATINLAFSIWSWWDAEAGWPTETGDGDWTPLFESRKTPPLVLRHLKRLLPLLHQDLRWRDLRYSGPLGVRRGQAMSSYICCRHIADRLSLEGVAVVGS